MLNQFSGMGFPGASVARVVVIACAVCVFLAPFSGLAKSGSSDDRPKDRSELRATEERDDRREERARDRAPRAKLHIRSRKPDDLCPVPHWGTVMKGSIHVRFDDGSEETVRAGDVYYWKPGHTVWVDEDYEAIEFSPSGPMAELVDHLRKKLE